MGRIEGPTKQTDTLRQQFIGHIKSISHLERLKNDFGLFERDDLLDSALLSNPGMISIDNKKLRIRRLMRSSLFPA